MSVMNGNFARRRGPACKHAPYAAAAALAVSLIVGMIGCAPLQDIRSAAAGDLRPPQLLGAVTNSVRTVQLTFDEPARIDDSRIYIAPEMACEPNPAADDLSTVIQIVTAEDMTPGARYLIDAIAADSSGNCLGFIVPVYGYNADVPDLVINEFITNGTSSHPDIVELAVLSDGDLAGVCLSVGSPSNWDTRMILPGVRVHRGDFVLIHCKPEGIAEEVDETLEVSESGGLDASDTAWDFWLPSGTGLSGNNGVLSLTRSPGARLVDAVIYSNRTSESDDRYRGFGSTTMMERVDEIVKLEGWMIAGSQAAPEDAVDPSYSTSTRSICRSSESADSDSRNDWHIVPTRGSTFGLPNSDEIHVP